MSILNEKWIIYMGSEPCNFYHGKTSHCLIRFTPERIAGILVSTDSISTIGEIDKEFADLNIPIYTLSNIDEINPQHKIIIGIAPVGGKLSEVDAITINVFLERGFTIINTLHTQIGNGKDNVINFRENKLNNIVATGNICHKGKRILFVGTDYSIGKMTATVALHNAMKAADYDVDWIPTGQTGKLIKAGQGLVLDSMVIDFMPGNLEACINENRAEFLLIEGQGSIFHAAFSPTSFGLFHASRPDYLILCDNPTMEYGHMHNKLPSIEEAILFYEHLGASLGIPCKVIGVAVNTKDMDVPAYTKLKTNLEQTLKLPCCDVVKENPLQLLGNILPISQEE